MTPRFCTQCGGPLAWRRLQDERHRQPVCTRCGHVEWQNPKPTASALITRRLSADGPVEVLLVRRALPPRQDAWDCPGGFIDPDEHPADALRREMREELGVDVQIGDLVGIFMDRYGDDESTLNIYYAATVAGGALRPGSDVSDAAWFPLDRLPEPIAFENNRQAMRAFAVRRQGA